MTPTFPTSRFHFGTKETGIERRTITGGVSLSGEQDIIATDGGGRVFAEFTDGGLVNRSENLAWRALNTILEEGVTPVIVPFCDVRHTPYGYSHAVPHSDDTPFSDDSLYSGGGPTAVAAAGAALRATSLQITVTAAQPLIGGEWFSIEHSVKGWRAYRIATVVDDLVTFRPPLREAVAAGQQIELGNPRCLMIQDGAASTRAKYGRFGEASIRFVEAP